MQLSTLLITSNTYPEALRIFLLEAKVHYGEQLGVDDGYAYGTADVILWVGKTLHIMDAKFGRVQVWADRNPQLSLYASGALRQFKASGQTFDHVVLHIIQPRAFSLDSRWVTNPIGIAEEVSKLTKPAARIVDILEGKAELEEFDWGENLDDCKYCKVQGAKNPKMFSFASKTAKLFETNANFFKGDIKASLDSLDSLEAYIKAVRAQAEVLISEGGSIEGYAMQPSLGNRSWKPLEDLETRIKDILPLVDIAQPVVLKSVSMLEKEIDKSLKLVGSKEDKESVKDQRSKLKELLSELTFRESKAPKLTKIKQDSNLINAFEVIPPDEALIKEFEVIASKNEDQSEVSTTDIW